jgi:diguanylate cyclase (GGDEF)-like protein
MLAVVMLDVDNFKFFNGVYGHTTGDEVLRQVAERLQGACRPYDTLARFGGDEFALLLPNVGGTSAAEIEARLRADLAGLTYGLVGQETPLPIIIPITVSVGASLLPQGDLNCSAVVRLADARLLRSKTGGDAESEADRVRVQAGRSLSGFSMLDALVTAVDNKDRYTRKHSEDVMEYSLRIARELGLDETRRRTVAVAALLHDVGKIGVPDAILRKPGKLSDEEFAAVKQHPTMGAAIVSAVPGLEGTLDAVRHHHERWDGGGYPSGLRGEETPLIARLMAVADAFSAMTTDRPYRQGMDREKALAILAEGAGAQWDPECVVAFRNVRARHEGKATVT